jgi:hypothetical protein
MSFLYLIFEKRSVYCIYILQEFVYYYIKKYVIMLIYSVIRNDCLGLTTCHTQCTWDRSICIFLFNRTTFQVFVTYLTGALHVHHLWFYKYQHDNRVRSKLFVACQPIHHCGKCWFKNSLTCRWKWTFLAPSVQIHTAIWSVLFMASC